jgi:thioredoxin reductase (NADPH)
VDTFDTVLFATGRRADTSSLDLAAAGVEVSTASGKIVCGENGVDAERTNVEHIYAIGDVVQGRPELTPVAVRAGEMLAARLFGSSTKAMDYDGVPTTVFTPFEYGCVGLSEEGAIAAHGAENIETYLFKFQPLELEAAHREKHPDSGASPDDIDFGQVCLSKLVCLKHENDKVIGFHYVGPNAGEITQGFALAVKCGATKEDFDSVVGIHPTNAESFTTMEVTRSSGKDFAAAGGCGCGRCG